MINPCDKCLVRGTCVDQYCGLLNRFISLVVGKYPDLDIEEIYIVWLTEYEVRPRAKELGENF